MDLATLLPSLSGALVGGAVSAVVAWRTIATNQRNERSTRRDERRRDAALTLIEALAEVEYKVLDSSGAIRTGPEAERWAGEFRRAVAVAIPALDGLDLDGRLRRFHDLLQQTPEVIDALGLDTDQQVRVGIRLGQDRRTYLQWVLASVQAVAAGEKAPNDNGGRPAPALEVDAAPWTAPVPESPNDDAAYGTS